MIQSLSFSEVGPWPPFMEPLGFPYRGTQGIKGQEGTCSEAAFVWQGLSAYSGSGGKGLVRW